MGHRKKSAPKRGSLAYLPRKRAKNIVARIRYWPTLKIEQPKLLGFIGYKAGMTRVFTVEDRKNSLNYGKEVMHPVTILETPPMWIFAIKAYTQGVNGLQTIAQICSPDLSEQFSRFFSTPRSVQLIKKLEDLENRLTFVKKIRVLAVTQPKQVSVSKKKPDLAEIELGGSGIEQLFEFGKKLLGKTVSINEVFSEGSFVDVGAVTKGKGFQGPVKRWGVRLLQRKARKTKRGVAAIGPWKPARVLYTVPRAGQMGFHNRIEYNKRILKIGQVGKDVTPKGGIPRYGVIRGPYILLEGSVPGSRKRAVKLRYPARPKLTTEQPPAISHISLISIQG